MTYIEYQTNNLIYVWKFKIIYFDLSKKNYWFIIFSDPPN